MKIQQSRRLLNIAIAVASVLVSLPTHAKPNLTAQAPAKTQAAPTATGTIVDIASANPNFKTLVTAVKAADLVNTLSSPGPLTVFVPTNAAFNALPKGTLQKLLKPENKATLQKVLSYHVVSGAIDSKSIKSGNVKTVEGSTVKVQVSKGGVKVNNANVIKADIKASNGIIHVINKVILPPSVKL